MASVSAEALFTWLDRGSRGGVFLVQGEEEYLKEETVQALIRAHLDPATRDFNLDQLRAAGLDPETLASICQTPPMLSEWRVVVVRDAQHMAANAKLRAAVEALLARELPGLALIFATSTGEVSKSKFQANLERKARTVAHPSMAVGDIPGWLIERAKDAGVQLEPAAARALAASTTGLGVLAQELAKLIEFVGDRKRVRTADVAQLVGETAHQNRWEWFDLVGERRFREARTGLAVLLDSGESGVGLLIGLGTHMLRLGLAAAGDDNALKAGLGRQQWLAARLKKQGRKWTGPDIDSAIDDMLRADRLLKSAQLGDRHVMDELLLRLQHGRAAA